MFAQAADVRAIVVGKTFHIDDNLEIIFSSDGTYIIEEPDCRPTQYCQGIYSLNYSSVTLLPKQFRDEFYTGFAKNSIAYYVFSKESIFQVYSSIKKLLGKAYKVYKLTSKTNESLSFISIEEEFDCWPFYTLIENPVPITSFYKDRFIIPYEEFLNNYKVDDSRFQKVDPLWGYIDIVGEYKSSHLIYTVCCSSYTKDADIGICIPIYFLAVKKS